jgi:polyhydroxyalkanoate synthase
VARNGDRAGAAPDHRSEEGNGAGGREPRSGQRDALDAVWGDVIGGRAQRWLPGLAAAKASTSLAVRPRAVVRRSLGLAGELVRVAVGRSELQPEKDDRRFKDPAWKANPGFRRLVQAYLALGEIADGLVKDADLDWRTERRVRFAVENLLDALAPTNFPLLNPSVIKATVDSGGLHFVQGARNLVQDLRRRPFLPSSVDSSKFEVGEDLALTPGAVVLRTELFELIQYDAQTEKVHEVPLLLVPQMINKYYIADLAPGRSMLEWAVRQGQQVFVMSWRNPDERHANWNFDTYVGAVLEALDAVEDVSGSDRTHVLGLCAGGNLATIALAHLAKTGQQDRVAGLTLAVTVLDWKRVGTAGAFMEETTGALGMVDSARTGYLSGKDLASIFAWMRPNDMVWSFWVNNYLLGHPPPPFDVLYWNSDHTNLPAALHRDFLQLGLENPLTRADDITVLGTPIDVSKVTVDTYCLAGKEDHISPWHNAYQTTQLLGSDPDFVLSTSGHIVAMVNPPAEGGKATFQTNGDTPDDADAWLEGAEEHEGSWWPHWTEWLAQRSGGEKPAPREPGGERYPILGEAPGSYVRETV